MYVCSLLPVQNNVRLTSFVPCVCHMIGQNKVLVSRTHIGNQELAYYDPVKGSDNLQGIVTVTIGPPMILVIDL